MSLSPIPRPQEGGDDGAAATWLPGSTSGAALGRPGGGAVILAPAYQRPPLITRRLAVALAVSVALHAAAFVGRQLDLTPLPELKRLEARMVRTAPDIKPAKMPPPPEAPKPKKKKKAPKPAEAPPQQLAEAQLPEPPTQEAPPPEAQAREAAVADGLDPPPELLQEAAQEAAPSPTPPETKQFAGTAWPRAGRITYKVFMGEQRFEAGKSTHQWEVAADGRYRIQALTEPVGVALIPWFKPGRKLWVSTGRLTEKGLQPESFVEKHDGKPGEVRADMDWTAGAITLAGVTAPLPDNTQDVLSFFYQLGYPGAAAPGDMAVTTGRRIDGYRFEVVGEETLELPFGMTWRAIRIRARYGQGTEMTEVWVAPEQFGLPIQIRNVDRKGVVYYLIATDVRVANDAVDRQSP